jgi:hypothetical protein
VRRKKNEGKGKVRRERKEERKEEQEESVD